MGNKRTYELRRNKEQITVKKHDDKKNKFKQSSIKRKGPTERSLVTYQMYKQAKNIALKQQKRRKEERLMTCMPGLK